MAPHPTKCGNFWACRECPKLFTRKTTWRRHWDSSHSPTPRLLCNTCGRVYKRLHRLADHICYGGRGNAPIRPGVQPRFTAVAQPAAAAPAAAVPPVAVPAAPAPAGVINKDDQILKLRLENSQLRARVKQLEEEKKEREEFSFTQEVGQDMTRQLAAMEEVSEENRVEREKEEGRKNLQYLIDLHSPNFGDQITDSDSD